MLQDALGHLDEHWAEHAPEFEAGLRPGVSDSALDRVEQQCGLLLTDEARTWWRWHDGVPMGNPPSSGGDGVGGAYTRWLTLALAGQIRNSMREEAAATAEPGLRGRSEPSDLWHPGWFPLLLPVSRGPVVIEMSDRQPTSPVHFIDSAETPVWCNIAPSLTHMVEDWLRLHLEGVYRWHGAARPAGYGTSSD